METEPRLVELEKPNLKRIGMNCDHILHPKLTKYPMTNDCFSLHHFTIVAGVMRAGKTTLVSSLLTSVMNLVYENVFIFMPSSSRSSMNKDVFGDEIPRECLFDELTSSNLEGVYEKLNEDTHEGYNSLIIIDDFQSQLKQKDIVFWLHKIITKIRHLRCSVILLQQNFQKLKKDLRELATNLIFFNLGKSQLEKVFDEVVPMKEDTFYKILDIGFTEPHDWMCINTHSKKIYKKFDEIVY